MDFKLVLNISLICQIFSTFHLAAGIEYECGDKCCAHHFKEYGICKACKKGTFRFRDDDNSACKPCTGLFYGYQCSEICKCSDTERCDNAIGCVCKNSTLTNCIEKGLPKVMVKQLSYMVLIGSTVTLVCTVSTTSPLTRVYWQKNTAENIVTINSTSKQEKYIGSTTTTPSLTILNAAKNDEGAYTCFATNGFGSEQSSSTILSVLISVENNKNIWYFISLAVVIVVLIVSSKAFYNVNKRCIRGKMSTNQGSTQESVFELYHEYQYIDESRLQDIPRRSKPVMQENMETELDEINYRESDQTQKKTNGMENITDTPLGFTNASEKNDHADDGYLHPCYPMSNEFAKNDDIDDEYLHPYNPLLKDSVDFHEYGKCKTPYDASPEVPSVKIKTKREETSVVRCNAYMYSDSTNKTQSYVNSDQNSTSLHKPYISMEIST